MCPVAPKKTKLHVCAPGRLQTTPTANGGSGGSLCCSSTTVPAEAPHDSRWESPPGIGQSIPCEARDDWSCSGSSPERLSAEAAPVWPSRGARGRPQDRKGTKRRYRPPLKGSLQGLTTRRVAGRRGPAPLYPASASHTSPRLCSLCFGNAQNHFFISNSQPGVGDKGEVRLGTQLAITEHKALLRGPDSIRRALDLSRQRSPRNGEGWHSKKQRAGPCAPHPKALAQIFLRMCTKPKLMLASS